MLAVTLLAARQHAHLTLTETAHLAEVPRGTLYNWESGRCRPRYWDALARTAKTLGIRPSALVI